MSTLESKLVTPCHFRADGVHCIEGYLYYSKEVERGRTSKGEAIMTHTAVCVEGEPVTCSACDGKGVILTEQGRDLLAFFDSFLRPKIHETCADYIDDKMGFSS